MSRPYPPYDGTGISPAVVQGQAIQVQAQSVGASVYGHDSKFPEVTRGEPQPPRFNDMLWTVLFTIHLIVIGFLSVKYIPQLENFEYGDNRRLSETDMVDSIQKSPISQFFSTKFGSQSRFLEDQGGEAMDYDFDYDFDLNTILSIMLFSAIFSFVLSIASLTFMMKFAEGLIKAGIIFQVISALIMAVLGAQSGSTELLLTGIFFFALISCFAYTVWSRIPFAASNLVTATTAVKDNGGLTFFAYLSMAVTIGWFIWWSSTSMATIMIISDCDAQGNCNNDVNGIVVFLFLLSLYWTLQIIKNVVHVTVAGTVGTWWWSPLEASSCCSSAVRSSYGRAMTYSFGSICLGSLIVAIVQTIKTILQQMRDADDGILHCIAECCIGCLESILELFNSFAFVYVGIYGYSFIDAAKAVINLFKERGWETIITDNLTSFVLTMVCLGNGVVVGGIVALICYSMGLNVGGAAFFIGLLFGVVLTQIVMGVVASAVDTVIVCYAEDPNAFQANHPQLSERMRETWRQAHPEQFKY